jgi:sigma-B regulation protein RsbU (phosphoserine phosphatase)
LLMSNLQATFRAIAAHDHSPLEVCEHLNNLMINYTIPDKYTSFFYGVLNVERKSLTYSNAGHPPPIVLRNNGDIEKLYSNGFLLGVDPVAAYKESVTEMVKGDVLLLYTDGIIETRNPAGEEFGENRLIEILQENLSMQENELNSTIIKTLETFSKGNIDDDITMVIVFVN